MSNSTATTSPQATESSQREQYQDSCSQATRHLCAGVYIDRSFRDLVIDQVHNDSRRRVAPSYGFDLVPVVRHAWRSWFLDTGLALAIVNCLAGGLILGKQLAVIVVMYVITVCVLLRIAARITWKVFQVKIVTEKDYWFGRRERWMRPETPESMLRKRKKHLKIALAGCVVVAVTPIMVSMMLGVSLGEAVTEATTIGCLLVASAVLVGVLKQLLLNAIYRADSLRPTTLTHREQVIDEQQSHPCVIYHRPEPEKKINLRDFPMHDEEEPPFIAKKPFIGSGELVNRWVIAIQLLRPGTGDMAQREHPTPPFVAHTLVERLRSALQQLATDPGPENLPGLQVRDRLYVAEEDICADRSLLRNGLGRFSLWRIIDDHRSAAHHFLEVSAPIAGGELVTTVLIRVSVKGRCLSLDVATCALTRTPQDYQVIDGFAEHGTSAVLRSAVKSVLALPAEVTRLWRLVKMPVVLTRAWWAAKDRTHIPRRGITVGAKVAIREEKAEAWENAQLDEATIYDHMTIIDQRIIKTTEDFLKTHDVDTSMFEKQATNIINNNGVFNMGGRMEVKQSAVGTKSKVIVPPEAKEQSA